MTFDKFTNRITLRGQLSAETGLHIGVGGSSLDPSATDSPVIRDAAGRPFIPGSSFKGAFRAHLESLVRGLDRSDLSACDPLADPCIPNKQQNGKLGIEQLKAEAEQDATENGRPNRARYDELLTEKILAQSCDVCRLFGSPWLSSHLMIKDLFVDPEWWVGRVELRDGVGIDRDTETARQGVKYDFEVVPASTRFNLEIVAENANDELLGLLAIGLRELEQGRVALGGKTTRGLGGVRLELRELEVVGDELADILDGEGSADLVEYLISGKGKILRAKELREYLNEKVKTFAAAKLQRRAE
ncbi:MAG: CRISPR-associated RAMP protein Csx7 [Acidobacteriota bacterium]|nr:CRISPR-associated RAMP protein Csx7 [Blastocatellia bacterium]MDW8241430.1 CRISPR-associated RAMP protein Csx7 [Acidobacteriota bacterium]